MALTHPRFLARKEYFGSLVYDRQRGEYIPFDWDATTIFEQSLTRTPDQILAGLKGRITPQSFSTFLQLCQAIDLLDRQGRFTGTLLNNRTVPQVLSAPLSVHLRVTQECTFNCRHCSQDSRAAAQDELTTQEVTRLIDDLAAIGAQELVLGGGDPFLRPDLLALVAHARQKGLSVSLSCTALHLNRTQAKRLGELGIHTLRISVDGATEKTFDYLRGKGTYRRAMRSLKLVKEMLPHTTVVLHSVLMKPNLSEMVGLLRLVEKHAFTAWSVDFVKPFGSARGNQSVLLSTQEQVDGLQAIVKLAESSRTEIRMPQFPRRTSKKGLYRGFGCVCGNLTCFVDSQGTVFPSSFLPAYRDGNIRETPLQTIWLEGPGFLKKRSLVGTELCFNCDFYNTCRGGCRSRAVSIAGDENVPDPICLMQPVFAEQAKSSEGKPLTRL